MPNTLSTHDHNQLLAALARGPEIKPRPEHDRVWEVQVADRGVRVRRDPREPHGDRPDDAPLRWRTKARDAAEALYGYACRYAHDDKLPVELVRYMRIVMLCNGREHDDAVVIESPFGDPVMSYATNRGAEAADVSVRSVVASLSVDA